MAGYYQSSFKSKDSNYKEGKEPLIPETQGDLELGGWNEFNKTSAADVERDVRVGFIRKVL